MGKVFSGVASDLDSLVKGKVSARALLHEVLGFGGMSEMMGLDEPREFVLTLDLGVMTVSPFSR
jgi:hypothetical protein